MDNTIQLDREFIEIMLRVHQAKSKKSFDGENGEIRPKFINMWKTSDFGSTLLTFWRLLMEFNSKKNRPCFHAVVKKSS